MRKVLSIVLALAMVLGCFASVFAAEFTDVKATDDFATAVSVLTDLGVVSGYTDGTYKPEKVVTRAEMASLIVKALGMTPAASATTNFSDVPATHWASGYIAYANSLGIIAGYTDGTFKPSKTVSYDEAITMIVQALGYTADGLTGTWPTAFVMKAQDLGVLDDVTVLGSTGANRGDVAHMLYNTLPAKFVKYSKLLEDFTPSTADKNTMYLRLGAKVDTAVTDVTPTVIEKAKVDLSEDLGAQIVAIRNIKGEIIAVDSYKTIFVEGKYTAGKTIGSYSIKDFDVSAVVNYVNGAVGTAPTFDKATKFAVDEENEKIVAAIQWKATEEFQVTADVKADATKIGTAELPTKDSKLDTTKFELVGADSIGDIKKNNVVTVYREGNNATGAVVKVEVGTETVTGKITAKTAEKITVNGTAYTYKDKVSDEEMAKVDFTNEFNLYFNYAGELVFVQPVKATVTEPDYAVVIAANYDVDGDTWTGSEKTETRQVKLLLTTGEEVVYDVAKNPKTADLWFEEPTSTTTTAAIFMKPEKFGQKLVTYTLKDGKLYSVEPVGTKTEKVETEILKNSTLEGKYFADSAVAFVMTEKADKSVKYSVVTSDKFAGMALKNAVYAVNTKGQIAALFTGAADAKIDAVYGIYTGEWTESKDGYTVSFFVDGAPVDYTATSKALKAGEFAEITFSGAKVSDLNPAATGFTKMPLTTGGALTGNTYQKADKSASFGLDAKVVVYIVTKNTDGTVKVELGALADLESKKNTSVTGYDLGTETTKDQIYDVVVIER